MNVYDCSCLVNVYLNIMVTTKRWAYGTWKTIHDTSRKISKAEVWTHVLQLDSVSELSGFVDIKSHVILHVKYKAQKVNLRRQWRDDWVHQCSKTIYLYNKPWWPRHSLQSKSSVFRQSSLRLHSLWSHRRYPLEVLWWIRGELRQ